MDSEDEASVAEALEPGDVLLNGATPAGVVGHGLARIAIARRAHYASFTGEVLHSLRLKKELHERARSAGVTSMSWRGLLRRDRRYRIANGPA